jgi:hypothetical protein
MVNLASGNLSREVDNLRRERGCALRRSQSENQDVKTGADTIQAKGDRHVRKIFKGFSKK